MTGVSPDRVRRFSNWRAGVRARAPRAIGIPAVIAALVVASTPCGAVAQSTTGAGPVREEAALTTQQPQLPPTIGISPGGAFWRAILLPGWGHASIGSYSRGGFYVAAQSATVYTLLRTRIRIGDAQDRVRLYENSLNARLAAEGITDPELIAQQLEDDQSLQELRNLLDARKDQQEDLLALSIFLMLISGADAYVSAHLSRFPEPLELEARPSNVGTLDLGLRVRLPN